MAIFPAFPLTSVEMLRSMYDRFVFVRDLLERTGACLSIPLSSVIKQMERSSVERSSIPGHMGEADWIRGKGVDLAVMLAIYRVFQWIYGTAAVPVLVGGDSVGLLVGMAATRALSLEDALGVLAVWHRIASEASQGRRLVRLESRGCPVREVEGTVEEVDGAEIFRIRSDDEVSVVGDPESLNEIAMRIRSRRRDATTRLLDRTRLLPFHSALCKESMRDAEEALAAMDVMAPESDIISTSVPLHRLRTAGDVWY
ncbi:MAG: hypothetical protein ABIK09_16010 [Pseudomonadota bacterium]